MLNVSAAPFFFASALAGVMAACASSEAPASPLRWEPRVDSEEGTACIGAPALGQSLRPSPAVQLRAHAPVKLFVTSDKCLSSSCSRKVGAQCAVQLKGAQLTVAMTRTWEQETSSPCTLDCVVVSAECETPPLAAGAYTLRHGGSELSFALPGKVHGACLGAGPRDR